MRQRALTLTLTGVAIADTSVGCGQRDTGRVEVRGEHDARGVLTSGYTESEVASREPAVVPDGFLRKPYSAGELLAALAAGA